MDSVLGLKEGLSQEQVWASMASLRGRLESLAPESLWQGWSLMMGEGPSVQVQYMELLDQSLGAQVNLVDYEAAQYSEVYSAWVKQGQRWVDYGNKRHPGGQCAAGGYRSRGAGW